MNKCQFQVQTIKLMANAGGVLDPIQVARRDIIDTCAANSEITITGTTVTTHSMGAGHTVFGGCMAAANEICVIPRYGSKITIINTDNGAATYPVTGLSQRTYDSCALSADGESLYISPSYGAYVGKMDLSNYQISNIGSNYGTSTGYKMYRGVTYHNKTYLFGTPSMNTSVIIDNDTDSVTEFSWSYGDNNQLIRPFVLTDGVYVLLSSTLYKISDNGIITSQSKSVTSGTNMGDFTLGFDGNYYSIGGGMLVYKFGWNDQSIASYSNATPSGRNNSAYPQLLPTGDFVYYKSGVMYYYKPGVRSGVLCNASTQGDALLFATNDKLFLVNAGGNAYDEISITYSATPRYFTDETLISPINNRG